MQNIRRCILKYKHLKENIKRDIKKTDSLEEKVRLSLDLYAFPRQSSVCRHRRMCSVTGYFRHHIRFFNMSRHGLLKSVNRGVVPGMYVISW